MSITNVFRLIIQLLTHDPLHPRLDELLAELTTQAAFKLHTTNQTAVVIDCVIWNGQQAYYALQNLLHQYGFELTYSRGPAPRTLRISIRRTQQPPPVNPENMTPPAAAALSADNIGVSA